MPGHDAPTACCVCLYIEHDETCGHDATRAKAGHHWFCVEHDSMAALRAHVDYSKQSARDDMAAAMRDAETALDADSSTEEIAARIPPELPAAEIRGAGRVRASMTVRHADGSQS